jgi:hypothetical protein
VRLRSIPEAGRVGQVEPHAAATANTRSEKRVVFRNTGVLDFSDDGRSGPRLRPRGGRRQQDDCCHGQSASTGSFPDSLVTGMRILTGLAAHRFGSS